MVSNQIIEVLNEICNKFGLTIDWTSKNVYPYLQELMGKLYFIWLSASFLESQELYSRKWHLKTGKNIKK